MTELLTVGIVGAGAMGANHARVVTESSEARLAVVVDPVTTRAAELAGPADAVAADSVTALHDCDAAIVACPTEHHAEVALDLIDRGIPVLVEKPLAPDLARAEEIVDAAALRDVPLMCGFVERFNAAVITAACLLDEPPIHVVSMRHSPPTPRITTSVVHDLLIHDIDLTTRFLPDDQVTLAAGAAPFHPRTGTSELADCILRFASGAVATLSASRASQRKIRSLLLTTSTALVDVDLLRQDVTVYRNARHRQVGPTPHFRAETTVDIPFVRHKGEPLALQFERFVALARGDIDPATERATLLAPHRIAAEVTAMSAGRTAALSGVVS